MSLTADTLTTCLHCGKEIRCGCVITHLCDDCEQAGHIEAFLTDCPKCREVMAPKDSSLQVVRGTVKFFLAPHGYGFAVPDGAEPGAPDVYLHWSQIIDQGERGRRTLIQGQAIQFQIVRGKNGRRAAINIQSAQEDAA